MFSFFPPSFCTLFCDIAQSRLNCTFTQENRGRIFSLLGFLSRMENGLNYICVSNSGQAIVKRLVIEKNEQTVRGTWCRK